LEFKDIEQAYLHDFAYDNIQQYLRDNHAKLFFKNNKVHKASPFVCGVLAGIMECYIREAKDIPSWLYEYIGNNQDMLIDMCTDECIDFAMYMEKYVDEFFNIKHSFHVGKTLYIDRYHCIFTLYPHTEFDYFKFLDEFEKPFLAMQGSKFCIEII